METTLLFLAACLMFSGVHSESQSMSCSTINGKTICNKQTSEGNIAVSSSQAQFGRGPSYQSTYAGAGNPNQWDSSSQTLRGGYPGGFYNPPSYDYYDTQETPGSFGGGYPGGFYNPPSYDYYDTQETPGSFGGGYPSGFYNPPSYDYYDTQETRGSFGGGPFAGVSSFASSGSPNFFAGSQAGGGAFAGGFAAAGNFPFFSPGVNYPAQDSSSPFGGAPAQGSSYDDPIPAPLNPFDFVNGFMGGRPAAGAFAGPGAGFFPFGRR